jgi:hypothetical protein
MKNEIEIRDEEIFLLGLCRLVFTADQVEKLTQLAEKVKDWSYFVSLAGKHGVASLICDNLERLALTGRIPGEQMQVLRNTRMLSMSRNAFLLTAAEEMLGLLNREGIKVLLLKGLALEQYVYGNRGLRQMTDADILVSRDDYLKAHSLLMENGYDSAPVKSGFHKSIVAWTGKHMPTLMKNGASIDLHVELFGGRGKSLTSGMISRAIEVRVDREKAFVPDPRLFFLFLVKHLHSHEMNGESQLRLYTDLVVMLEKYRDQIICYELLEDASKAGLSNILAWKLEPLRDLWGISFPGWIDDHIDKWFSADSINKFVFFLKSPAGNKPERPGQVYRNVIREVPGFHRKILFLLGDIFPTLTFMKNRYGCKSKAAAFLYYPIRFGKIFWLIRK